MPYFGKILFKGESGTQYTFEVYSTESEFRPVAAVYIISDRYLNPKGSFSHKALYIDQTDSLFKKFESHPKFSMLMADGANAVCILPQSNKELRHKIVNDLNNNYNVH